MSDDDVIERSQVEAVIHAAVTSTITTAWTPGAAESWKEDVPSACLKGLAGLGKPYKYSVCCHLAQRGGPGLYTAATAFWNPGTDGHTALVWESDTVFACVIVIWAAL